MIAVCASIYVRSHDCVYRLSSTRRW